MNTNEVIEILKNEKACVQRKIKTNCTDCMNCDLVRGDKEILEAYDFAIETINRVEALKRYCDAIKSCDKNDDIDRGFEAACCRVTDILEGM